MPLFALGINHTTAPVEIRERVAFPPDKLGAALHDLRATPGVAEAAILSTCNRTEVYCLLDQPDTQLVSGWLRRYHDLNQVDFDTYIYQHPDQAAVRHMLRVASGLDSMILGEPQILGQSSPPTRRNWRRQGQERIAGRIYDADGGYTDHLTNIPVNPVINVAPVVYAGGNTSLEVNTLFTRNGSFSDPNDDTWTAQVDYGDGSGFVSLPLVDKEFTLAKTYTSTGLKNVTVRVSDDAGLNWSTGMFQINVATPAITTFRVQSVAPTNSGFDITFTGPVDLSVLNLYDGRDNGDFSTELPDLTVTGSLSGTVHGSLIWDAATNTAHWVKTGGTLAADTYTLALRSATDGWKDTLGELLDGDSNNAAGGDYSQSYVVGASVAPVVSLPDFARGPNQPVDVPANGIGLPLRISNGSGVTAVDFELIYDSTVLTINPALSTAVPPGWTLTFNDVTPGHMSVSVFGGTALSAGLQDLIHFNASVPSTASYGASNLLRISNLNLNAGGINGRADDAVQKVAFFGDATGNGGNYSLLSPLVYSSLDASVIAQLGVDAAFNPAAGFDAYDMTDPVIVADVSGNGTMSSLDASYVSQELLYLSGGGPSFNRLEIPNLPTAPPTASGFVAGPDPTVVIQELITGQRGSVVNVPVNVTDDFAGTTSVDMVISYDPSQLDLTDAQITLGSLTAGWTLTKSVNRTSGLVIVSLTNSTAHQGGTGSLFNLAFTVRDDAPAGTTIIDIVQPPSNINEGSLTLTSHDGSFTLGIDTPISGAAPVSSPEGATINLTTSLLGNVGNTSNLSTVTDSVGNTGTDSKTIIVANVEPVVSAANLSNQGDTMTTSDGSRLAVAWTNESKVPATHDQALSADGLLGSPATAPSPSRFRGVSPSGIPSVTTSRPLIDNLFADDLRFDSATLQALYRASYEADSGHLASVDALFDRLGEAEQRHPRLTRRIRI